MTLMWYNSKANSPEQKQRRKLLRSKGTSAEAILWLRLKGRAAGGYKFRRQQGIGPYIMDFFCPELRLCVELDGNSHDMKNEYDLQRTQFLNDQGIVVIRFPNDHVCRHADSVVAEIVRMARSIDRSNSEYCDGVDPTPAPPL